MSVQLKEITIAHSPDSDDAFMFYAIANNKLDTKGLKINQAMKDIQSLNLDAINKRFEVTAISFAAYPSVCKDYALTTCGASMCYKYGPIVVAKKAMSDEELKSATIAIPGKLTSAWLTLQLFQSGLAVVEYPFDKILDAVINDEVDAGLLIHEGQLTYGSHGLKKIVDLGEWWYDLTSLPLPLGGNVVRKDLGQDLMKDVTRIFRSSIVYSLEHRAEALEYALTFARDMPEKLADKFVGMYVNELTVDCGESGRKAVETLFRMAYEKGILKEPITVEWVDA